MARRARGAAWWPMLGRRSVKNGAFDDWLQPLETRSVHLTKAGASDPTDFW